VALNLVWHAPALGFEPPALLADAFWRVDKTALHPARLVSALMIVWLLVHLVPPTARWVGGRGAAPFVLMGQQGLAVFCAGIFLSFLGRLAIEASSGLPHATRGEFRRARGADPGGGDFRLVRAGRSAADAGFLALRHAARYGLTAMRALALVLMLSAMAAPARAEPAGCGAPAELLDAQPMPGLIRAAGRGTPLRALVIGSASVTGPGGTGPAAAWPSRFATLLGMRLQPSEVTVEVQGGRGLAVADHVRLLAEWLPRLRPQLVIWQVGTIEAARGVPRDEFAEALRNGLAAARAAGAEVVLMDPQFSRFLRANADVEAYRDTMRLMAAAAGAQVFSRWSIMLGWAESDRLDLERAPRARRTALTDELNDCLARALVEFVLDGMAEVRR
jgi:hypothetical protein